MTPEEKIDKEIVNMRMITAVAIRDEIENLEEDAEPDDEAFDELLANIDDLIQEYRQ